MRTCHLQLRAFALCMAVSSYCAGAEREMGLLEGDSANREIRAALQRIEAELRASGHQVRRVNCASNLGLICSGDQAEELPHLTAIIRVLTLRAGYAVEVRGLGPKPNQVLIRRSHISQRQASPEVLATDAVELTRVMELDQRARAFLDQPARVSLRPRKLPESASPSASAASRVPDTIDVSLEVGVAAASLEQSLAPELDALVGASLAYGSFVSRVLGRSTLAGPTLSAGDAHAEFRQQLALAEAGYRSTPISPLELDVSAVGGLVNVEASGRSAVGDLKPVGASKWAAILGAAFTLRLNQAGWTPFFRTEAAFYLPRAEVKIGSENVRSIGAPTLLAAAGVEVSVW